MNTETRDFSPQFGPTHVVNPLTTHTHTAIVLHGRGSNGQEFAEEFFSSHLSDNKSLAQRLPGWRWVFPSSPELWSSTFQESMPAWFEAHSLTDIAARRDLQISGIRASVKHVQKVIDDEITKLNGNADNIILGGISQGAAIGMWCLLCSRSEHPIGAFFGSSTWLPFAANIERMIGLRNKNRGDAIESVAAEQEFDRFVSGLLADDLPAAKVFLGHGADDAYVDVTLGRQARNVLSKAGFEVDWKEYSGAEEEGHWFKVPEQMDDIYRFIVDNMPG